MASKTMSNETHNSNLLIEKSEKSKKKDYNKNRFRFFVILEVAK